MKFSFLCDAHRQELITNVSKSIRFWQDGFDTAQFFNDHGLWIEALPHAGCAYEVAEIFISNRKIDIAVAYEWFYASTILLTQAFDTLGYKEEALEVMGLAIERFDRELALSDADSTLVMDYLNKLHWQEPLASGYPGLNQGIVGASGVSVH